MGLKVVQPGLRMVPLLKLGERVRDACDPLLHLGQQFVHDAASWLTNGPCSLAHARSRCEIALPDPCLSAAQVRLRCAVVSLFFSCVDVGCTNLPPPPVPRSRNHASHSRETMRTTFGAFRHAVSRRSSRVSNPSPRAARSALRTVVSDTPASAAIWPIVRVQRLCPSTSAAITASTAVSEPSRKESQQFQKVVPDILVWKLQSWQASEPSAFTVSRR